MARHSQVIYLLLPLALLILQGRNVMAQALKPEDIYSRVVPSIMTLGVETKDGDRLIGTAFLAVKEGLAVTAWHLVKDARRVAVRFANNEEFESSGLVGKDEKRDVALIRVKVAGVPVLGLQSAEPAVGSKAYVIGVPQGLQFTISNGLSARFRRSAG